MMSWLEAWKRVEQATRHARTAGCQTIPVAYLASQIWENHVEVMAGCLLGKSTVTGSLGHAVAHAVGGRIGRYGNIRWLMC
jgi:hypothetical protein